MLTASQVDELGTVAPDVVWRFVAKDRCWRTSVASIRLDLQCLRRQEFKLKFAWGQRGPAVQEVFQAHAHEWQVTPDGTAGAWSKSTHDWSELRGWIGDIVPRLRDAFPAAPAGAIPAGPIDLSGPWYDYRTDPRYREHLAAAGRWKVALWDIARRMEDAVGCRTVPDLLAYKRATRELTQMPMEFAGPDARWQNSRWRHADVLHKQSGDLTHCEHPWTKKGTEEMLAGPVMAALRRGGDPDAIAVLVCVVIDARQDTVLLPSATVTAWDVTAAGDGLARYRRAASRLIDRKTAQPATAEMLDAIDREVENTVKDAITRIEALAR